jgi:chromosome segregation ATPase
MMSLSTVLLLAIAACSIGAGTARGQSAVAAQEPSASSELMQEVRALRVALERFTAAGTRAQILLGRLRMQEDRVASIGRQLQEVRARLLEVQHDSTNTVSEIKRLTAALDEMPGAERRAMESRIANMKAAVKRNEVRERDLQAEDNDLAQTVASEQSRWLEFSVRLDELERGLAK